MKSLVLEEAHRFDHREDQTTIINAMLEQNWKLIQQIKKEWGEEMIREDGPPVLSYRKFGAAGHINMVVISQNVEVDDSVRTT